jgi:hypothetical protein
VVTTLVVCFPPGDDDKEETVEIQSNVFTPKYLFTVYLKPLVYGVGFFFLSFVVIQRGWYGWDYALILALFGFPAFQEAGKLIKEIEFGENEMIVRYFLWREKSVDYHNIKNVDVNISIGFSNAVISLKEMTNRMELQKRLADILRKKKIREINIEKEIEKKSKAGKKIFSYAFAFTVVIGVVASSIVNADLATWALMLVLLFAISVIILSVFIKS